MEPQQIPGPFNIEEFDTLVEAQVVVDAWRTRVQHLPTLLPRWPHPGRVLKEVDHQPTSAPVAAGPFTGVPSAPFGGDELVGVLATMALACIVGERNNTVKASTTKYFLHRP